MDGDGDDDEDENIGFWDGRCKPCMYVYELPAIKRRWVLSSCFAATAQASESEWNLM